MKKRILKNTTPHLYLLEQPARKVAPKAKKKSKDMTS